MAETLKEKENDVEEKAEISKNAQFRAIQPSPSILSYVEDNVICMTGLLMFWIYDIDYLFLNAGLPIFCALYSLCSIHVI